MKTPIGTQAQRAQIRRFELFVLFGRNIVINDLTEADIAKTEYRRFDSVRNALCRMAGLHDYADLNTDHPRLKSNQSGTLWCRCEDRKLVFTFWPEFKDEDQDPSVLKNRRDQLQRSTQEAADRTQADRTLSTARQQIRDSLMNLSLEQLGQVRAFVDQLKKK